MAYLETGNAKKWIIATLKAGGIGAGVYGDMIPQNAAHPALVVSLVTGVDANSGNGMRGASDLIFLVKAVDKSQDASGAESLMTQADALLQQKTGQVPGLKILSCVRESIVDYPEIFEGVTYRHVGGQYRLWVGQA